MKICVIPFNIVLMILIAAGGMGCKSMNKKPATTLRFHLEMNNSDRTGNGQAVSIGKSEMFNLVVQKDAFLDEGHVMQASVVSAMGGFAVMVQFNRQGTWILEQYTTAARGMHIGIFSQFGEARWIAAPVITHTIKDGQFVFTPDTTREEAQRLVKGLNEVAKSAQKNNP